MTYVMSDIHGEYDRFWAMLQEIGFSDTDKLYILGDLIDRGPEGIRVVQDVMHRENVQVLIGNHEQMCLDAMRTGNFGNWEQNNCEATLDGLLALSEEERTQVLDYMASLPDYLDIRVGSKKFHLVHGWPGDDHMARVWGRPQLDSKNPFRNRRRVIVGHTPVFVLNPQNLIAIASGVGSFQIEKSKGFIDIDCGCGYPFSARRLACLRLEDMKEFYV